MLASLGLTLLLSTSASVALAEEANSVPAAKESTFAPLLEYNEQEPNDTFEQANYYFIGDAVIGTLGEEKHGMWENYDVYKIMAENKSSEVHFTIQGHKYPDSWLELTLFDSNGQSIKSSKNGQYFLNATLEQGKDYYLAVNALGLQFGGKMFDYKLSSEAVR